MATAPTGLWRLLEKGHCGSDIYCGQTELMKYSMINGERFLHMLHTNPSKSSDWREPPFCVGIWSNGTIQTSPYRVATLSNCAIPKKLPRNTILYRSLQGARPRDSWLLIAPFSLGCHCSWSLKTRKIGCGLTNNALSRKLMQLWLQPTLLFLHDLMIDYGL